jgi:hypothetical protein
MANFNKWLDTLVSEKGLNVEQMIETQGASGANFMPLSMVLDAIKSAIKSEQDQIKHTLVAIDFKNGDVMHFFKHLAGALAI